MNPHSHSPSPPARARARRYTCKTDWCGCSSTCAPDPPAGGEKMFAITSVVDYAEASAPDAMEAPPLLTGQPKPAQGAPAGTGGGGAPAGDGRVYKGGAPAAGAPPAAEPGSTGTGNACPPGVVTVNCFVDPCRANPCASDEKCESNYCESWRPPRAAHRCWRQQPALQDPTCLEARMHVHLSGPAAALKRHVCFTPHSQLP